MNMFVASWPFWIRSMKTKAIMQTSLVSNYTKKRSGCSYRMKMLDIILKNVSWSQICTPTEPPLPWCSWSICTSIWEQKLDKVHIKLPKRIWKSMIHGWFHKCKKMVPKNGFLRSLILSSYLSVFTVSSLVSWKLWSSQPSWRINW